MGASRQANGGDRVALGVRYEAKDRSPPVVWQVSGIADIRVGTPQKAGQEARQISSRLLAWKRPSD